MFYWYGKQRGGKTHRFATDPDRRMIKIGGTLWAGFWLGGDEQLEGQKEGHGVAEVYDE